MKKLINDPADVVTEALRGVELAHPQLRVDHENKVVFRGDAPVQGKVGHRLRRRVGARAAAGRLRRPRRPRRRVCRGGVHLAGARPDARGHEGRRRRRGRAAHRAQLHRRHHELRDGRRAGRRRGRPGRDRHHERRRRRRGQPLHRRAPRRRAPPSCSTRSPGRPRTRAATWRPSPRSPARSIGNARSMGMALTSCTVPAAGPADLRPARRPDGGRHRRARRAGPAPAADRAGQGDRRDARRADPQGPRLHRRRRRLRVRQRHGRHAAARAVPHVRRGGADPGAVGRAGGPLAGRATT